MNGVCGVALPAGPPMLIGATGWPATGPEGVGEPAGDGLGFGFAAPKGLNKRLKIPREALVLAGGFGATEAEEGCGVTSLASRETTEEADAGAGADEAV